MIAVIPLVAWWDKPIILQFDWLFSLYAMGLSTMKILTIRWCSCSYQGKIFASQHGLILIFKISKKCPLAFLFHRPCMDGQVCFYRQSFVNCVKPLQSTTGSMESLMGTNKATWCVKLLLTTVWAYQIDYFCALQRKQCWCLSQCGCFCLPSASHPPPPLPARPPPINFICDITTVDKNHLKSARW